MKWRAGFTRVRHFFITYGTVVEFLSMKKIKVVQSNIQGKGLIALENIKRGQFVGYVKGTIKFKINKTPADSAMNPDWVGFKANYWTDPLPPFKYLNHSCNPTCGLSGTKTVRAMRDVVKGEEITIDYSTTEVDPHWKLDLACGCKSKNCRKKITSIHSLPAAIYKKYLPLVPSAIRHFYDRNLLKL
jgi:uncharacterized protein